jgi:RNA polymerase sigma-70 factor (ECF subfamily)
LPDSTEPGSAEPGSAEPGSGEFTAATERFRRELLAHCYRMLGSVDDAEDVVQETYLRAWRSYGGFEGRSSARAWLYRIATNACLTALEHRGRRALPSGLGGPEADPAAPPVPAGAGVAWLQPVPDALVIPSGGDPGAGDPAAIAAARQNLRLALIASLQYLPARQRAVLLLRDVLAFPAAEAAAVLGMTTVAAKSALQRARARLAEVAPAADRVAEPAEPAARALLDRYIAAFENADAAALEQLLRQDVTLEATPLRTWFAGMATCLPFLSGQVLGSPGDWRMIPAERRPYGVVVLTPAPGGIAAIRSFGDPGLVSRFGFPEDDRECR